MEIKLSHTELMFNNRMEAVMSTVNAIGNFVWASDSNKNQKERQEQYLELMYMHQQYNGIIIKQNYVSRESKLSCSFGSNYSLLDIGQDHGIYKGNLPLMTAIDSGKNNIYHFGSCLCPESNYAGRLPMTAETHQDGKKAKKAINNKYAHICVPMVPEGSAWKQVDHSIMAKTCAKGYVPVLVDNAVLVCQYGGLITVVEVPQTGTTKGLGQMTISQRGFDLLKHHENNPSVLQGWGLGVYNGASLIGIYPHYVFRKNKTTGQWESDGGITVGFGHYISQAEYVTDASEKAIVDKYAKGAPLIPSNIPSDGVSYIVPSSTYMPIQDVETLLRTDIGEHEQALSKTISGYGFAATQEQFDALVNLRYHKYRLGADIDDLLDANDCDKSKWENAIKKLIGTNGDINRADDLIDLFNNGIYPSGI